MTKQKIIEHLEKELKEWRDYASDLECRHRVAIKAISDLSQGYGREVLGRPHSHWMQKLAGEELSKIALMKLRIKQ